VPQPVNPGDEIGISIRVDSVGGVALTYEWVLTEGKILEGEGTNAITYQAPIEPGTYSIRVKVTSADAIIQRSTFINVHEAGTSVSTLTNTVQLTSTLAQKPLTETITPSSTMPLVSTLTSTPISATNTPITTTLEPEPYWLFEKDGVPESSQEYSVTLFSGQILLFTGGEFKYKNIFCGGGAKNVCVLVYTATKPQAVEFTDLYKAANYVGVSDTYTSKQMIAQKLPQFWQSPNCGEGCQTAIIYYIEDGREVRKQTLLANQ